jgi:hypothetical protein
VAGKDRAVVSSPVNAYHPVFPSGKRRTATVRVISFVVPSAW